MILQNQIRCLKCGNEPWSASRHDYKECKCGAVAVDGGCSYLKRTGTEWEDMSFGLPKDVVIMCEQAVMWSEDTGRNELGTVIAVLRALRDAGYCVVEK